MALADSKFDEFVCSVFSLNNKNVNALIPRELWGFTCTRSLTVQVNRDTVFQALIALTCKYSNRKIPTKLKRPKVSVIFFRIKSNILLDSLVHNILFEYHSKIKFMPSRRHVISSVYFTIVVVSVVTMISLLFWVFEMFFDSFEAETQ